MIKKIIFRSSFGILVLILIFLIFLPLIVRKTVINNSKEWIGRSISLDKLKVNYFTGTVKLIDFILYEADDSEIFVRFDTLIIDCEPYQYFHNELVIEQLYLKGLHINVAIKDSVFNFDDLMAYHQSDSIAANADTVSEESLSFELSNFELRDASYTYHDVAIDKQVELHNIDFYVPYLSWGEDNKSEAGLRFDFKNGGYFQSNININPIGGEFDAEIVLNRMDITGYSDFVRKYIDLGDFNGLTDVDIQLAGNINRPEETKASGLLVVHDFNLIDHDQKSLFGLENMRVRLKEADAANHRYVIDSILLNSPKVYFEMIDSTNNIMEYISKVFPPEDTTTTTYTVQDSSETESGHLYYALNSFTIDKGIIDIVDKRTEEPFKYHLSELDLSADSISSNSTWVESHSNMLLNNRGKLVAQVGINPSNLMDLMVDYTITDFMLSDLNIYSRHYMGFPILYGDMYYKAHTEIINGQITSENKLVIHNVELGNKGGGIYDLPLKFALFLLKDKDGVINLDVPVRGDLKDPKVSIGKIVWNTFKNLIIKAAAAPVKLLSGLIGADPTDIEAINYDFLDTTFTEKRQRQLDLLMQLEKQKPDLEIELIYFNDPELEKREIAMVEVGKTYEANFPDRNYEDDKEGFEEFVLSKVENDTLNMLDACMLVADHALVDSIAASFDKRRFSDIDSYLHQMNDSTEISVIIASTDAPKNLGSKPIFEVKYGMKEEKLP